MNSMHEAYIKARMNKNEEEGFNELAEIIETGIAQTKKETYSEWREKKVAEIDRDRKTLARIGYSMGLLELCEKGLYNKIKKGEAITVADLPAFVWKELCQEVGAKILESCTIDYSFSDDDEEKRDVRIRAMMAVKHIDLSAK